MIRLTENDKSIHNKKELINVSFQNGRVCHDKLFTLQCFVTAGERDE